MAEYVANEELQKEEESSAFTLSAIWTIVVLNWQWIVLSTIFALGLAFIYLRYTQPVYTSAMKVLIKDDDNKKRSMAAGQMNLESMGIFSNSNGFDNELEILNSTNINSRVVKSLKLYVSYAIEGRVRKFEQYQTNPIIVDMPQHQLAVLRTPIEIEMTKEGKGLHVTGKMRVEDQKEPVTFERNIQKLPGSINTPMGIIMFQQNPGTKWKDEKLYATILPIEIAARIYRNKLSATATSKTTTVANVTFTDTQVGRSIDYLNDLLKSYNDDANEDKNEVAMKTEEFIKERIDFIRGELDVTEGEMEQYKKNNELINLTNDATTALSSTTEYQKKQVEIETQLNLINALVKYVNDPANAMQVIPANLGLDNNTLNTLIGNKDDLGKMDGWTFDEMKQYIDSKPADATLFEVDNKTEVPNYFMYTCLEEFVDWNKGECYFDQQSFKNVLELCNKGSDEEIDYMNFDDSEMIDNIKNGKQLFLNGSITQ